jgi:hypothetical protein
VRRKNAPLKQHKQLLRFPLQLLDRLLKLPTLARNRVHTPPSNNRFLILLTPTPLTNPIPGGRTTAFTLRHTPRLQRISGIGTFCWNRNPEANP